LIERSFVFPLSFARLFERSAKNTLSSFSVPVDPPQLAARKDRSRRESKITKEHRKRRRSNISEFSKLPRR